MPNYPDWSLSDLKSTAFLPLILPRALILPYTFSSTVEKQLIIMQRAILRSCPALRSSSFAPKTSSSRRRTTAPNAYPVALHEHIQDWGQNAGVYAELLDHQTDQLLSLLLTLADADATVMAENAPVDNGFLTPLVDGLEGTLRIIQNGLDKYKVRMYRVGLAVTGARTDSHTRACTHSLSLPFALVRSFVRSQVPYSYGWSIVALTVFVKTLTFPLTKIQVEATMSQQKLKPEIDLIKEKYGDDKDAVSRETSALYEKADINPLAGCLPTLATIPIFIGLYRSFSSVASQGDLDNQGFYWIPSLAGPTSVAAQRAGEGTAWLLPFVVRSFDSIARLHAGPNFLSSSLPYSLIHSRFTVRASRIFVRSFSRTDTPQSVGSSHLHTWCCLWPYCWRSTFHRPLSRLPSTPTRRTPMCRRACTMVSP